MGAAGIAVACLMVRSAIFSHSYGEMNFPTLDSAFPPFLFLSFHLKIFRLFSVLEFNIFMPLARKNMRDSLRKNARRSDR